MLHQNIIPNDTIFITDLICNTTMGCKSWERAVTQPVVINISITTNFSKSAIDYQLLINSIVDYCNANIFDSLELLAIKIEELMVAKYAANILALHISAKKLFPATNIKEIGVSIARTYPSSQKS